MIPKIFKSSSVTGLFNYAKGEGRDRLTGKANPAPGPGDNSRSELLGGNARAFGFAIETAEDAELARKMMEWSALPENQASRTKPCVKDAEHIILAWAKGQNPDKKEKIEACEEALVALGMENARAVYYAHHDADHAHVHIIASRIDPDTGKTYSQHEDMWRAQAWALKWERERNQITAARKEVHRLADAARTRDFESLRGILTEKDATFSRRAMDRAFALGGDFGADRDEARKAFLNDRNIVPLREQEDGPVKAYTTRAVVQQEQDILEDARTLHRRRGFGLKQETLDAVAEKYTLTDEQRSALMHLGSDDGLAVVEGQAGTGKTHVMKAYREALEREGRLLRAGSFQNKVVADQRRDGFTAQTIRRELKSVDRDPSLWKPGTVLAFDEMGQVSHEDYAALMKKAKEHDVKVAFIGDGAQLGSVDRGGMFPVLADEFNAAELKEVMRQKRESDREASKLMHGSKEQPRDFATALKNYQDRGAIHWHANRAQAARAMCEKYMADVEADPSKRRMMGGVTNEEVKALNEFAHTMMRERGRLGEDHLLQTAKGEGNYATGDRIAITGQGPTRASVDAGLYNGAYGQIDEITLTPEGKRQLSITLDGAKDKPGGRFRFVVGENREAGEFNQFSHGYASTVWKSQGQTVDDFYGLHSPRGNAPGNYVANTRHKDGLHLYVGKDQTKDFDELVKQAGQGENKTAAHSYRYRGTQWQAAGIESVEGKEQMAANDRDPGPRQAAGRSNQSIADEAKFLAACKADNNQVYRQPLPEHASEEFLSSIRTPAMIAAAASRAAHERAVADSEIKVCKSAAGYYLGRFGEDGPIDRDSEEYWRKEEEASAALSNGKWTPRGQMAQGVQRAGVAAASADARLAEIAARQEPQQPRPEPTETEKQEPQQSRPEPTEAKQQERANDREPTPGQAAEKQSTEAKPKNPIAEQAAEIPDSRISSSSSSSRSSSEPGPGALPSSEGAAKPEQQAAEPERPKTSMPDPQQFAKQPSFAPVIDLGKAKQPGKTVQGLREDFKRSSTGSDFMSALKERGFQMARVDEQDQLESDQRREDAKNIKGARHQPHLQQGDTVAINQYGTIYKINSYVTGAKKEEIDEKLSPIDKNALPNVRDAYFEARADAAERAAERRDPAFGKMVEEMKRTEATWRANVDQMRADAKSANNIVQWREEAANAYRAQSRDEPFFEPGKADGIAAAQAAGRESGAAQAASAPTQGLGRDVGGAVASGSAAVGKALDVVAKAATMAIEGIAKTVDSMGHSAQARAYEAAKEQAIEEAAPTRKDVAEAEREQLDKQSVAQDRDDKTKQAQDPKAQRYASAMKSMKEYLESEKDVSQDEGRTISRDRGGTSR